MLILIPARLRSYRVPRKMLALIGDKPLIQHTYENTARADCAERIIVMVDDPEVDAVCKSFGAETIDTSNSFSNGTERCAYVADLLGIPNSAPIINVQGDNWNVNPKAVDEMATNLLSCHAPVKHSTLYCMRERINDYELHDPSFVKVITDANDHALFFTRSAIRFADKHCGIYGYYSAFLSHYALMKHKNLEASESLEQMRVLENGGQVYCPRLKTTDASGESINTTADLERANELVKGERNGQCFS